MPASPKTLFACPAFFPLALLASRVPWPEAHISAPLNPDPQQLCAASDASLPCVRFAYAFFYLPAPQAEALLHLALNTAALVLAVDFKLAERNLELPAALAARGLMALAGGGGGNHPKTGFMQRGGMEGLARQSNALVLQRRPILGGAAVLLHLQRP